MGNRAETIPKKLLRSGESSVIPPETNQTRMEANIVPIAALKKSLSNMLTTENSPIYAGTAQDSKDVMFIAGIDTKIEDASPSCEAVPGYTKEELQRKTARGIVVDPAMFTRFRDAVPQLGAITDVEVELLRKDGRKIDARDR